MRLSAGQLSEYQELHLQAFGSAVNKEEATSQALALLRLVKIIVEDRELSK